jgi:hypothetical protein
MLVDYAAQDRQRLCARRSSTGGHHGRFVPRCYGLDVAKLGKAPVMLGQGVV